jgi:glutamate dehydrogenase
MKSKAGTLKSELVDSLTKLVRDRMPAKKSDVSESFLRQFYTHVSPQDMLAEEHEDLFGAAMSILAFAGERQPGTAKVRAYTPRFESNGWQSAHTVIEIVNDDMPFLVDSVTSALVRMEMTVHLVIHPIIRMRRDAKGRLVGLAAKGEDGAVAESVMHLQISEQSSEAALAAIETELGSVLSEVRAAVEDWRAMRQRMLDVIGALETSDAPIAKDDAGEVIAFLRWIEANHFTFLGYREFNYLGTGKAARMDVLDDSGLGILRDPGSNVFDGMRDIGALPEHIRSFLMQPRLLLIMKANRMSRVHRAVHLDAIGIKKIDAKGKVVGEHRFVGLFTSVAYNQSPGEIPLLRQKVDRIVARAGFGSSSHAGKALVNILETYPRDELLQSTEDQLYETAIGILNLQERQKTALFYRKDAFERFVSCLVYVPRDRYNTDLRERIGQILAKAFNGHVDAFFTQMSESVLARTHMIIGTTRGDVPEVDPEELTARLLEASRSWDDRLRQAVIEARGEERGNHLMRRYGARFGASYREAYTAQAAVFDMERMEEQVTGSGLGMNLYRPVGADDSELHLKLFHRGEPIPLSDVMPMIENMGVRVISEAAHEVRPADFDGSIWIHDFRLMLRDDAGCDIARVKEVFQEAFGSVWAGAMENDGFNVLVLHAGLAWRQVSVLRAYAKYLRQAGFTFSQDYMEETLAANPAIARNLVSLFEARFDPDLAGDRAARCGEIAGAIDEALEGVTNLDQDRILRRFLNLVQVTLRTNFHQQAADGGAKPYISFKLDSQAVEELPLPRPLVEIWVYSPRTEAVHLRGGRVARGGIRWSDRREDFRTEILGLMKAQMVKNAVIVPVGSKGGFVVKRPPVPATREAVQAEGIECYKILMRGLLDITDNLEGANLVPPRQVVRHDGDDPYLVVAADKGTATFSDIANGVSQEYGFWLDDAFASGGSAGYDHKKMGITAKGAWESVKRHFREIGVDIQSTDFTCVGVGDMSGDVFGNGMLLSKHIRLLGAFNHLHIFVDPDPDATASWGERQRLFDLPRSSWGDYDRPLISKGGGVFDRSAKSIRLTPEIKAAFGIAKDSVPPSELMRAMLKAPVDLLWFGGIGSYIKSVAETNAEVGDRGNDAIRIDGRDVRAKVIGEGANLGCTQRGRIEFALKGGRNNTDAIDNSAGVDCSDHEVNIKILLGAIVGEGELTVKQRDRLLVEMTGAVGELVLKDNYDQSQALTMAQAEGPAMLDAQGRLMRQLERGPIRLDRAIEYLPDEESLAERAVRGTALTRPELAVLLAYAKMELYDEILPSDLPDDGLMVEDLVRYFPAGLHKPYRAHIARHRLKREIIATYVTNSMINRVGATFVNAIKEQTGDGAPEIARAYIAARDVLGIRGMWARVEGLDNKVPAAAQTDMLLEIKRLASRAAVWLLKNERRPLDLAALTAAYKDGVAELVGCLDTVLSDFDRSQLDARAERFSGTGVPDEIARAVASAEILVSGCDIVRLARQLDQPVARVAEVYFAVGARFGLDWLRGKAERLLAETHWQKLAVSAVVDDFFNHQFVLTQGVLANGGAAAGSAEAIEHWEAPRRGAAQRTVGLLGDLKANDTVDLAMLAVANGQFRALLAH